eukprot:CAMPEP_0115846836 /NCGR_PEP_ID=MMETSP0287-20121206/10067_1 /TAXON_ID=412157 /ORGANISM="Chrysochromulina rotalis, Strain UIO044" /LENGTH=237 /DNA_ID=CAMNT_0003300641 /DNA_START=68 /DNA_END=781 /DNA_ORIENTATION=+
MQRSCRICFSDEDEASNPLLRPCKCRGSMSHVHVECLNEWRRQSANPHSFYQCDTCKYNYKFGTSYERAAGFTRVLARPWAVHLLSLLGLATLIWLSGFAAKAIDPALTWWDVITCFNLEHIMRGSIATAFVSLFGWFASLLGGGGGNLHFFRNTFGHWADGGRGGNAGGGKDTLSMVFFCLAVVAGLCLALYWIYGRLETLAKSTIRMAQHVVLDVGDDGTPGPEPRGGQRFEHVD